MVTAIILFVLVGPRFIDFKDTPVKTVPLHSSEVLVKSSRTADGRASFVYEVRADDWAVLQRTRRSGRLSCE